MTSSRAVLPNGTPTHIFSSSSGSEPKTATFGNSEPSRTPGVTISAELTCRPAPDAVVRRGTTMRQKGLAETGVLEVQLVRVWNAARDSHAQSPHAPKPGRAAERSQRPPAPDGASRQDRTSQAAHGSSSSLIVSAAPVEIGHNAPSSAILTGASDNDTHSSSPQAPGIKKDYGRARQIRITPHWPVGSYPRIKQHQDEARSRIVDHPKNDVCA